MTGNDIKARVLDANLQFYQALSHADLDSMISLWLHNDDAQCIHPGWNRLQGWINIEKSWRMIFENSNKVPVIPGNLRVSWCEQMAWVNCIENIAAPETNPHAIKTICTNVYQKNDDVWKMVIHHSSFAEVMPGPIEGGFPPLH